MEKMYKDFAHYGHIIHSWEYDFSDCGKYVTLKVIELNDIKVLFTLVNGEVKSAEYLGVNL